MADLKTKAVILELAARLGISQIGVKSKVFSGYLFKAGL